MSGLIQLPKAGYDVRLNVAALTDPATSELSANAFSLWCALTTKALETGQDGFVADRFLTPTERYPGLPWIRPEDMAAASDELQVVGLLEVVDGGVIVPWDWQTTAEDRARHRERNRVNQANYRVRKKADDDDIRQQLADAKAQGFVPQPPGT